MAGERPPTGEHEVVYSSFEEEARAIEQDLPGVKSVLEMLVKIQEKAQARLEVLREDSEKIDPAILSQQEMIVEESGRSVEAMRKQIENMEKAVQELRSLDSEMEPADAGKGPEN